MDAQPVPLWESLGLWPSTRVRLGASDGAGRDHGPGAELGLRACPGKRARRNRGPLPDPSGPPPPLYPRDVCVFPL